LPYPGLVVTRAIGDNVAKKLGVLHEPDIANFILTPEDKYIVLGTDGVFDGISNNQVLDIVSKAKTAKSACKEITKASLEGMNKQNLDDNTTNICVFIDFTNKKSVAKSKENLMS
jgi:serine/threonine protein phosphatase PrpC